MNLIKCASDFVLFPWVFNFKLTESVLLFYQYFTTKQIPKINENILLWNKQALICLNFIASFLFYFLFCFSVLFHHFLLVFDKLRTSYKNKHIKEIERIQRKRKSQPRGTRNNKLIETKNRTQFIKPFNCRWKQTFHRN